MRFKIFSFENGAKIPGKFAFCIPSEEGHISLGENINPHLGWDNIPKGTKSLAIICHDPDVPSVGDDVNQEGKTVSKDLPRVDFYHWILIDIPTSIIEIPEGAMSEGVITKGKEPGNTKYGIDGINNYTDWFAGDKEMAGNYGGYDGPCPPWNDEIIHHYVFTVYALDVETLGLKGIFGGPEVLKAMKGHILEKAEWIGTYTLNPELM
ncbi:MAG TPA: YbhB/YbcL family Raf kinase inhibitor-like protein [Candidatus Cloacimonetes bacterium]|nr:YbhB/YbcL family Raf kinase inhibitor-like protein [Candidatus Cloacimonadota bacterium]